MSRPASIVPHSHAGQSLLRCWASVASRHITLLCSQHAPFPGPWHRSSFSTVREVALRSGYIPNRSGNRPPSTLPRRRQPQHSDSSTTSAAELEEADRREEEEDDKASFSLSAIRLQLDGLNAIAQSLQAEVTASNRALLQHNAAAPTETVKRLTHRAATIRSAYETLIKTAYTAHEQRVFSISPRVEGLARMSPQLAVMERVWLDMCNQSQPTVEAFTCIVMGYGREAMLKRIRGLFDRWLDDKEKFMLANGITEPKSDSSSSSSRPLAETGEEDSAVARKAREIEAVKGLPSSVSLYPAIQMDTVAYNVTLSSYLASLSLKQLTSESPELAFPLSLLPRFQPDSHTISILMRAHGLMGETAQVVRLFEQYKQMRRDALAARGWSRELQVVRKEHKTGMQYVYATLLNALANAKDVEAAETVWSEIKQKASDGQLDINRVMYHSMLAVYATANQHEKLRSISVDMSRSGLAMDEHSVCTVLSRLLAKGHVADAIMLHNRIPHGSLGPAKQHRKTYMCLLVLLALRAEVPFLTVVDVYRQGVESGRLSAGTAAHSKSKEETSPLSGRQIINLRGVPLELVPVALHYHLSVMLDAYMAAVRQAGRAIKRQLLPRGLLIVGAGKEELSESISTPAVNTFHGRRDEHRLSVEAIDWDEEETMEEAKDDSDAEVDAENSHESTSAVDGRSSPSSSSVLVDPFASIEERSVLSQLEALEVRGNYVQRYVQHLLEQEWPSLPARLPSDTTSKNSHSDAEQAADVDPSLPQLHSASSLSAIHPRQLRINRNQMLYWLEWHAHVVANDAETFPPPGVNGQSQQYVAILVRRIKEKQQQLYNHQRQWERVRRGEAAADAVDGSSATRKSLADELREYKRRAREELEVKARVFNTKQLPAGGVADRAAPTSHKGTAVTGRGPQRERVKASQRRANSAPQASPRRREQPPVSLGDAVADEKATVTASRTAANTGTARRADRHGTAHVRSAAAADVVLSSETLSSLRQVQMSPATKQALHAFNQQQKQTRAAQKQANNASK